MTHREGERADVRFIEPIKKFLPWKKARECPIAKERILVIYADGRMSCDTAFNFVLIWHKDYIKKWCYFKEVITKRLLQ